MRLQPGLTIRDHSIGPVDAPVQLVQFGDYLCAESARAERLVNAVRAHYGLSLRFAFRHFHAPTPNSDAYRAAEAAESVAVHKGPGAFWLMHELLFEYSREAAWALDEEHVTRYAWACGADPKRVAHDLATGVHRARVAADIASGAKSGVIGTPAFFINGDRFVGDWHDLRAFGAALAEAEARAEPDSDYIAAESPRRAAGGPG